MGSSFRCCLIRAKWDRDRAAGGDERIHFPFVIRHYSTFVICHLVPLVGQPSPMKNNK